MKTFLLRGCLIGLMASYALSASARIATEWIYHAASDVDPATEMVPGEDHPFLVSGGSSTIHDDQAVTIYLLTPQNFAGDMEEQLYIRWWDGYMAHWVMGVWVKNIDVGGAAAAFRGEPAEDAAPVMLDLWRAEIPAWVTQPGINYYAIQLKGYLNGQIEVRYLLRESGGDFCGANALGQVWSVSEDFEGQDWRITITGE